MSNDKRINILATAALVAIFVRLYGFSRDDLVIELWVPVGMMAAAAAYCFWPRPASAGASSQKKAH